MFVVLLGSFCSGRSQVLQYLLDSKGFERLSLNNNQCPSNQTSDFSSFADILEYTTLNWKRNFVTTDVTEISQLELAKKRPFVLVALVDAPIEKRYQTYLLKNNLKSKDPSHLLEFISLSDTHRYSGFSSTSPKNEIFSSDSFVIANRQNSFLSFFDVTIFNVFVCQTEFFTYLDGLDITNLDRLRPSWDLYFMKIAELASHRSNCMKRRVGCILVQDNQILSTGYNGTPKNLTNCNDGGCDRCNMGAKCGTSLDDCLCIHAEENALLQIGANRISSSYCILYCNTCPCLGCAKKIVQSGVKEVVYNQEYGMDDKTSDLFTSAKITFRRFCCTL